MPGASAPAVVERREGEVVVARPFSFSERDLFVGLPPFFVALEECATAGTLHRRGFAPRAHHLPEALPHDLTRFAAQYAGGGGVEIHDPAARVEDQGTVTHALDDGVVRHRGDV
ncbi:MAG: hypothetical protein M3N45_02060 [Actinomycetota bacterium]|nr:hypothetical protein [Actinomycetota bacterium]